MDFGHFLVNHTEEEKIEVGSVPSGPNVGVELFGEGGGLKLGRLFQRRAPYPIFSGRIPLQYKLQMRRF